MTTANRVHPGQATPGLWRLLLVAAAYVFISAALAHVWRSGR